MNGLKDYPTLEKLALIPQNHLSENTQKILETVHSHIARIKKLEEDYFRAVEQIKAEIAIIENTTRMNWGS